MNGVGVILINWNGGQLTKDCIDSLRSGSVVPDYIVVVDNDSKDDSIELLTKNYGNIIHIIKNSENKGFAEANNQGIKYLIEKEVEYIWLLNNDTIVDVDCLSELLKVYQNKKYDHIGAVSAKTFYESKRNSIWYAGAVRNPYSFAIKHLTNDINENLETSFISGCCIFTKSGIFEQFGGLQKEFIAYSEDDEWSLRLERRGYSFLCVSKAILYHKVSASLEKNTGTYNRISDRALFLMNRNHLWVIRRYAPHKFLSIMVMIAICLRNMLFSFGELKRSIVYLKGLYHGIFDDISFILKN